MRVEGAIDKGAMDGAGLQIFFARWKEMSHRKKKRHCGLSKNFTRRKGARSEVERMLVPVFTGKRGRNAIRGGLFSGKMLSENRRRSGRLFSMNPISGCRFRNPKGPVSSIEHLRSKAVSKNRKKPVCDQISTEGRSR